MEATAAGRQEALSRKVPNKPMSAFFQEWRWVWAYQAQTAGGSGNQSGSRAGREKSSRPALEGEKVKSEKRRGNR